MRNRVLAMVAAVAVATAAAAKEERIDPELIGGQPAPAGAYPASVYAQMGNARCSATVVGEKTLLIAAHCVSDGGTARFSVGANAYTSKCTHHPDYSHAKWMAARWLDGVRAIDATADWSLCLIDKVVAGVPYELVAVDATQFQCQTGKQLMLTGYGCTRSGGGGGNDGVYRVGKAPITSCPNRDHDTVTRGSAALCYGDSGGPAFFEEASGARWQVSVNSRGNISTISYLSSTYTGAFKTWALTWSNANAVKFCGLHADAKGCRGGATPPPPPPPPPPPGDCNDELTAVLDANGKTGVALAALKSCMGG